MADTLFKDGQGRVYASWLNDVNDTIYKALGAGKTAAAVIAALGLATVATSGAYADLSGLPDLTAAAITSGTINGTVIGGTTPAAITGTTGTFSTVNFKDSNHPVTVDAGNNLQIAAKNASALLASLGGGYLTTNAYYDGSAWQRYNTANPSNYIATDTNGFHIKNVAAGTGAISWGSDSFAVNQYGRTLVNGATDDGSTVLNVQGDGKFNGNISISDLWLKFLTTSANAGATAWALRGNDVVYGDFSMRQATSNTADPASGNVRFYIAPSGHVLIGTTADGADLLQVAGSGKFAGRVLVNGAADNGSDALQVAGTGIFTGAGIPGVKVRATGANTVMLSLADNAATPNEWWLATGITGANDGWFGIYDKRQAINRLAITPTGRTLIGTTADNGTDALQVNGSGLYTGTINANNVGSNLRLKADGTTANDGSIIVASNGNLFIQHWGSYAAGRTAIAIFASDRVAIGGGNNPADNGADALQVNGSGNFSSNLKVSGGSWQTPAAGGGFAYGNSAGGLQIAGNGSTNDLTILNKNQSIVFAIPTGTQRVLIAGAADNSTDALQVNGTTHISSSLTCGSIYPNADNTYSLGSSGARWTAVYAVNGTIQTSDRTMKQAIADTDLGLDFINALRPVSYRWRENDNGVHYGLIAQEVDALLDRLGVKSFAGLSKPADGYLGLNYSEFIAPLIRAVQELSNRVKQLEKGAA